MGFVKQKKVKKSYGRLNIEFYGLIIENNKDKEVVPEFMIQEYVLGRIPVNSRAHWFLPVHLLQQNR